NPEITLISESACDAFPATATLAIARVGLSTQTRRTATSAEPKPAVTRPSTKLVFVPVISIAAVAPAGSAVRLTAETAAAGPAGYVYSGGFCACRIMEFCPSGFDTVTTELWPAAAGGGVTVMVPTLSLPLNEAFAAFSPSRYTLLSLAKP